MTESEQMPSYSDIGKSSSVEFGVGNPIDVNKLRSVHESRFRVVRDILKSQSESLEALSKFCNDCHRWMVQVDTSLRQQKLISSEVAPPLAPVIKGGDDSIQCAPGGAAAYSPSTRAGNMAAGRAPSDKRPDEHHRHYGGAMGGGGMRGRSETLPVMSGNIMQASNELLAIIRNSADGGMRGSPVATGSPMRSMGHQQYQRTSEWECDSENDEGFQQRPMAIGAPYDVYGRMAPGGRGGANRGRGRGGGGRGGGGDFLNGSRRGGGRGGGGGRGRKPSSPQQKKPAAQATDAAVKQQQGASTTTTTTSENDGPSKKTTAATATEGDPKTATAAAAEPPQETSGDGVSSEDQKTKNDNPPPTTEETRPASCEASSNC